MAREAQDPAARAGAKAVREFLRAFFHRVFMLLVQHESMKKLLLLSALVSLLTVPVAQADEAVRSAQSALQGAGYYTGPVDGELNADTKAAVRRYQIRNQLEPTGELTPETIAALNKEGASAPVATPAPQPPQAAIQPVPPVQSIVPPPAPAVPEDSAYTQIFTHTPYENALPEVQFSTVRKAQKILAERRLFQGVADGRPGPATEEALIRFQASRHLARTGRLDIDTLAELHLLPVSKLVRPRGIPEPFVPQVPPTPRGAVRGTPLD